MLNIVDDDTEDIMIFLVQTEDFHTEVGNDVGRVVDVFRAGGEVFDVLVRRVS